MRFHAMAMKEPSNHNACGYYVFPSTLLEFQYCLQIQILFPAEWSELMITNVLADAKLFPQTLLLGMHSLHMTGPVETIRHQYPHHS